jgi:hypothetical protein
MSDGVVRKWVRMFNEGRENVHDETRIGRPALVNADLERKVKERVRDNRRFTISDLSLHFPQIFTILLYDTDSSHLVYRKVCFMGAQDVHRGKVKHILFKEVYFVLIFC